MQKKGIYTKDIRPNNPVRGIFLVRGKTSALTKNGAFYLALTLADKTGEIEARAWERGEEWDGLFKKGDYISIEAQAESYRDQTQLNIMHLTPCSTDTVEAADFLPSSSRDTEEMWRELKELAGKVRDSHLTLLLTGFFHDKKFRQRFRVAPAAKRMHHAYLGGLLEHTLSVTTLVTGAVKNYPELDKDLLVTGSILHDIGKIKEFTYPPESSFFDYTDEGRLVGHLVIGAQMVQEKIEAIPHFPEDKAMLLKHLILSHHGEYESGSPKRPKTAEAFVLHLLDDLDAKVNAIKSLKKAHPETPAHWSSFFRPLDRYIYFGVRHGEEEAPESEKEQTTVREPSAGETYSLIDRLNAGKK
ncbi:MAG: HD domain-containing protein [Deltaproteobacteria bacterium]|nr:HD domain-containing protein [Deltaproteobacteria bacterium]